MENFFIGFLFIFLNFNITVSNHVIGLLPGFVGYIFINRGIKEFEGKVPAFDKVRIFAKIMIWVYLAVYVMDFLAYEGIISINRQMYPASIIRTASVDSIIPQIYSRVL